MTPDKSKTIKTGPKGPGNMSSKGYFGPKSPKKLLAKTNHDMLVMVKTKHNPVKMIEIGLIEPKSSYKCTGPNGPEVRESNNSRKSRNLGVIEPRG